jgi:hypothetical protein
VGIRVSTTGATTIPDTTDTLITLNTVQFNTSTASSLTGSLIVINPLDGGMYTVNGSIGFITASTGARIWSELFVNGALYANSTIQFVQPGAPSGTNYVVPVTALVYLPTGGTIGLYGWQNSGYQMSTITNTSYTQLSVAKLK